MDSSVRAAALLNDAETAAFNMLRMLEPNDDGLTMLDEIWEGHDSLQGRVREIERDFAKVRDALSNYQLHGER